MFRIVSRLVAPLAVAFLCAVTSAQAGIIANATFGFVPFGGGPTYTGASLSVATSVTLPALEMVNVVPPTYLGNPNDFFAGPNAVALASAVTVTPLTLPVSNINGGPQASVIANYLVWGAGNRYSFDMTSISWTSSSTGSLNFFALGTFKDSTTFFDNNVADISGSFTQAVTGTVNGSFTFETPPAPVPEPGTLVIVLGLFCGVGVLSRRRHES